MTEHIEMKRIPEHCKLFEMVQYQCEANINNIECTPFVRLFLKCTGLPTVEVTPEYDQYGDPVASPVSTLPCTKGEQHNA
ncbi:hypothetical protein INT47_012837 [Mucor saturninus]|uniref:Uncharacterized protein n=1 Tax=Mucor saturninus TaxID=64648 RepID=A0A8H7UV27_9FUNG|nr:hypothetical protein INT47_012837 [Mucor saturninus]